MRTIIITALLALLGLSAVTEEIKIKPGDRLCIVGDSITEAKLYCKFIEVYLAACYPELKAEVLQLGWSGEVAPSFFRRMRTDLEPFKPTIVTLYYGMNDGGCAPYNETTGKRYGDAMEAISSKIVNEYHAALLIGSAGAVDTFYFKTGGCQPQVYNETLGKLSDICKSTAEKNKAGYTDIHSYLKTAMAKAKEKLIKHERVIFDIECRCGQVMEIKAWTDREWNVQCGKCGKIHRGVGRIYRRPGSFASIGCGAE